jgi:hypothetical protein
MIFLSILTNFLTKPNIQQVSNLFKMSYFKTSPTMFYLFLMDKLNKETKRKVLKILKIFFKKHSLSLSGLILELDKSKTLTFSKIKCFRLSLKIPKLINSNFSLLMKSIILTIFFNSSLLK